MTQVLLIAAESGDTVRTRDALDQAIVLSKDHPVQVHLLNVQPQVSSHVATFFGQGELHRFQHEAGAEELADCVSRLKEAGLDATCHVRIGRRAETIARVASELHCDAILMGQDDHPGVVDRLFGSVAEQVRHLLGASSLKCQVIGT